MPEKKAEYPGQAATAEQVRALADEYRRAAGAVEPLGRAGEPASMSPWRLLSIQVIELYLNAFLLAKGHAPSELRSLQHDLAARARLSAWAGLALRRRTAEHLAALRDGREYLVARYSPDGAAAASRPNRLAATLDEVARKTAPPLGPASKTHAGAECATLRRAGASSGERAGVGPGPAPARSRSSTLG